MHIIAWYRRHHGLMWSCLSSDQCRNAEPQQLHASVPCRAVPQWRTRWNWKPGNTTVVHHPLPGRLKTTRNSHRYTGQTTGITSIRDRKRQPWQRRQQPGHTSGQNVHGCYKSIIENAILGCKSVVIALKMHAAVQKVDLQVFVILSQQKAQLPQRDSASATHVFLGSLTDRALHWAPHLFYNYIIDKLVSTLSSNKPCDIRTLSWIGHWSSFKVILIGAGRNPERCVVVMRN